MEQGGSHTQNMDPWEDGIPPSVLTRDDIIDLVNYSTELGFDLKWFSFWYEQSEWHAIHNAWARVDQIGTFLGEAVVNRVVEEVWGEFQAKRDPRLLDIYLNGTPEQIETERQSKGLA